MGVLAVSGIGVESDAGMILVVVVEQCVYFDIVPVSGLFKAGEKIADVIMGEVLHGGEELVVYELGELLFVLSDGSFFFVFLGRLLLISRDVVGVSHEFPFIDETGIDASEVVSEIGFGFQNVLVFQRRRDSLAESFINLTEVA